MPRLYYRPDAPTLRVTLSADDEILSSLAYKLHGPDRGRGFTHRSL